jgi:hypothetical protein
MTTQLLSPRAFMDLRPVLLQVCDMMLRVGFDMDGVLADLAAAFARLSAICSALPPRRVVGAKDEGTNDRDLSAAVTAKRASGVAPSGIASAIPGLLDDAEADRAGAVRKLPAHAPLRVGSRLHPHRRPSH